MTRHNERPAFTEAQISTAAGLLKRATRVVFFTGAGMSADSGIATFRASSSGFWGGITGPLLLAYFGTPAGWRLTPGYAWRMYLKEFYGPIARAAPHEGHMAIARLERERFPGQLNVVTMNVDGYHQKAGNTQVWEVHGTVNRNRCPIHGLLDLPPDTDLANARCPVCGRYPRPDVVLFTEPLPSSPFLSAHTCISSLEGGRDVMVVVGTTGVVYPAAGLPEEAMARGVKIIEVNLDPSPLSPNVDVFLQGRARDVLPRLIDMVLQQHDE